MGDHRRKLLSADFCAVALHHGLPGGEAKVSAKVSGSGEPIKRIEPIAGGPSMQAVPAVPHDLCVHANR